MQESDTSAKVRQLCSSEPLQPKQLQPDYVSSYRYHGVLKVIACLCGHREFRRKMHKKKELEMAKEKKDLNKWYITRYSKEKERIFLFYAAVAMSILYGYCRLF